MSSTFSRRGFLQTATALTSGAAMSSCATAAAEKPKRYQKGHSSIGLTMNTSTLRPQPLMEKIRVTAEAGWDGIELWFDDLEKHEKDGGSLKDLGKLIADKGLFVINVIGLWDSMPTSMEAFEANLPKTRNRMRMAQEIGSRHAAAIPPHEVPSYDLILATTMYKRLLDMGRKDYGIIPAVEFVGFFKSIYRLGQACCIAVDADDADACVIADTYHLFRGGSGFNGLRHLNGNLIANFHWNDVPPNLKPEGTGDETRIYPGDGCLPLVQALKDLKAIGYDRTLSLEVFNREYWKQDPLLVSQTGIEKIRAQLAAAGV